MPLCTPTVDPDLVDLDLLDSLLDRVETAVSTAGGRNNIPRWLCHNTRHPTKPERPWSFFQHEFMIGILEDQSPHMAIQKAAQVGISEVAVRILLALCAKLTGAHFIYVLPTFSFARKFSSSRIDPVIEGSPRLARLTNTKTNSTELKKIGSCYVHIGGAASETQAISIPASGLFRDEYSFGDPNVLAVYQSRLGHCAEEDRILYDLSTPLYPGSGITEVFESGTQAYYLCYHDRCGQWVIVNSLEDIVLPGFDDHLRQLTKRHLDDRRIKTDEAWAKCAHCGTEISRGNLSDPTRRAWVQAYPDRPISSYHIDPLAAAAVRTPPQIIRDLRLYRKTAKWVQYAIGQPYEDAESTITDSALEQAYSVDRLDEKTPAGVSGAVAGMDIGKLSYIWYGKKLKGKLHLFAAVNASAGGDNEMAKTFLIGFRNLGVYKAVIDAAPDVEIVKYVQRRAIHGCVWGGFFLTGRGATDLDTYSTDEANGVVRIKRTALIDEFVKEFNAGRILLPRNLPFEAEVNKHFKKPKRIVKPDAYGEDAATWVSGGEDHWFFAALYAYLAYLMLEEDTKAKVPVRSGSIVGKVKMRGGLPDLKKRVPREDRLVT